MEKCKYSEQRSLIVFVFLLHTIACNRLYSSIRYIRRDRRYSFVSMRCLDSRIISSPQISSLLFAMDVLAENLKRLHPKKSSHEVVERKSGINNALFIVSIIGIFVVSASTFGEYFLLLLRYSMFHLKSFLREIASHR